MNYEIRIDKFEGPLDLLLHLIRKEEMNIQDIQIAQITTQYLAFIDEMKSLNLDVAGEYLVMAATLLHIKSRFLLPIHEEELAEEEEIDPRAELIRRLLDYQRYKDAAVTFAHLPQLERDVFLSFHAEDSDCDDMERELEPIGIFELVNVFRDLLKKAPTDSVHEVTAESLSVTERIQRILIELQDRERVIFSELLPSQSVRSEIVVMFLAMLELVKMKLVKIYQNNRCAEIWLFPAVANLQSDSANEDALGYA